MRTTGILYQKYHLQGSPGTRKTCKPVQPAVAVGETTSLEEIEAVDSSKVVARYRGYRAEGRLCVTTLSG